MPGIPVSARGHLSESACRRRGSGRRRRGAVVGWCRRLRRQQRDVFERNETLVPVAVFFEVVENVLAVRIDQFGPRLPQRMHDVVDEADL